MDWWYDDWLHNNNRLQVDYCTNYKMIDDNLTTDYKLMIDYRLMPDYWQIMTTDWRQSVLLTYYVASDSFSLQRMQSPPYRLISSGLPVLDDHSCVGWDESIITSGQHCPGEDWQELVWGPKSLHTKICHCYPAVQALSSIDPLLVERRAIMFNGKTPLQSRTLILWSK